MSLAKLSLAYQTVGVELKISSWTGPKEKKEGIKDRVVDAIRKLEYHKKEVQVLRKRLQERSNDIFRSVVASLQDGERDKATIYANENSEIKKILKVLRSAELALTQVVLRLESIRDVGEAMREMEQAFGVVKSMGKVLEGMSMEMSVAQDNIQSTLTETMSELQQLAPDLRLDVQASNGEDIVEEAMKFIEGRIVSEELPDSLPSVPGDNTYEGAKKIAQLATSEEEAQEDPFRIDLMSSPKGSLDDAVASYVNSKGGKLDVYMTAMAVGRPVDEVEKSLLKLVSEGKLRIPQEGESK